MSADLGFGITRVGGIARKVMGVIGIIAFCLPVKKFVKSAKRLPYGAAEAKVGMLPAIIIKATRADINRFMLLVCAH